MANEAQKCLEPWHRLDGKVVMVTGASSGLGREFCLDLAKAGCYIVAAARRKERLVSLCNEINQFSSSKKAIAVELDVSAKGSEIDASVQKAWDAFGWIDVLVNNAGVRGTVKSPLNLSEEEWNNTVRTNLTGSWLVTKYVCERMRDANVKGSVINISSVAGLNCGLLPGAAAYSASKAALNNLTKDTALELGKHKIRVNSISPGVFKSEITEKLMEKKWLKKVNMRIIPLRDLGTSDPALTSLVRYLIHDSSEYVSGNVFIVDAGSVLPGSWLVTEYVHRRMCGVNLKGSVTNISSISGLNCGVLRGATVYATSKDGLNTLTMIMASEFGVHKIRVNSISPGLFRSEITERLMEKEWLKKVAMRIVPLSEHGTSGPALTSLVRYLIHDSSGYVSGNVFQ